MNQNDYHNPQGAGYGQMPVNPAGEYPRSEAFQGYPSQQGYQQAQPYASPMQAFQQPQRGYQTPQVTGSQPTVNAYQSGYQSSGVTGSRPPVPKTYQGAYQNPYAQQGRVQAQQGYTGSGVYAQVQQEYVGAGAYAQPGSFPQQGMQGNPQQGYTYPGNQAPGVGYIPQTPYQQPYNPQGYQPPAGYGQPYNAYAQMGRSQQIPVNPQQETRGQMPLNGGGYVPQPVPVKRRPFVMSDSDLLILSAILLILFALGMFVASMSFLKWVFLALAAGSTVLLWVKPLVAKNKRLCYTIVFALLMIVTLIGFVTPKGGTVTGSGNQGGNDLPRAASSGGETAVTAEPVAGTPEVSVTFTPEPNEDNAVTDRLQSFFYYWSANRQDDMLTLCSPSWQSKEENPKTALFGLMANRTPKDYAVEGITGTIYDTTRTVTVTSTMDRNNGKDPVRYRLSVIMTKENDDWYVDPQSLQTYEAAETTDPSITATPAPTETPAVYANTILYYNPNGGEYYHLDQYCKKINERYLPLQGHFTYAELSDEKYSKLKPCAICGAPLAGQ